MDGNLLQSGGSKGVLALLGPLTQLASDCSKRGIGGKLLVNQIAAGSLISIAGEVSSKIPAKVRCHTQGCPDI